MVINKGQSALPSANHCQGKLTNPVSKYTKFHNTSGYLLLCPGRETGNITNRIFIFLYTLQRTEVLQVITVPLQSSFGFCTVIRRDRIHSYSTETNSNLRRSSYLNIHSHTFDYNDEKYSDGQFPFQ